VANRNTDSPTLALAPGSNAEPFVSRIIPEVDPDGVDPNHHLWRNGRLWWVAFTVHHGYQQERVRFSLRTDDVEQARRRRDDVFARYAAAADCKISIRLKARKRCPNSRNRSR
jgi:hypothetical protein